MDKFDLIYQLDRLLAGRSYRLRGRWFPAPELQVLIAFRHLLKTLQPGLSCVLRITRRRLHRLGGMALMREAIRREDVVR